MSTELVMPSNHLILSLMPPSPDTYAKKLFIVYVKFRFNSVSYIFIC